MINHPRCNLNQKNSSGETALHHGEYLNIFKLNNFKFIILFKASFSGHDKVVRLLINHPRCNLNEKDEFYQNALHLGEYLEKFK